MAVAWVLLLGALALWTANPVTLNREQLLLARANGAVVEVAVEDRANARYRVQEVLAKSDRLAAELTPGLSIQIDGLSPAAGDQEETLVVPMIPRDGAARFEVVPTAQGVPLTYPAAPQVKAEMAQLLK